MHHFTLKYAVGFSYNMLPNDFVLFRMHFKDSVVILKKDVTSNIIYIESNGEIF